MANLRRVITNSALDVFFRAGSTIWRTLSSEAGMTVTRDVPYVDDGNREHLLDVYRPDAPLGATLPTVLYLHGGSFRILSKDSHFMFARAFCRAGYLVFNASYRLAPRSRFPAALEDAVAAYRFVVDRGRAWGADPSRLVVAGESAGANLTLGLGVMSTYERPEPYARAAWETGVVPRAIAPLCGLLQVSDPHHRPGVARFEQDRIALATEDYLGVADAKPSDEHALADPLLLLERGVRSTRPFPPAFASVGTKDPLLADTRRLKVALDRLGVDCEAPETRGMPHAFQALTFLSSVQQQWDALFAFLARHV